MINYHAVWGFTLKCICMAFSVATCANTLALAFIFRLSASEGHFPSCLELLCCPACVAIHLSLPVQESHKYYLSAAATYSHMNIYCSPSRRIFFRSHPIVVPEDGAKPWGYSVTAVTCTTPPRSSKHLVLHLPVWHRSPRFQRVSYATFFSTFFVVSIVATFFLSNLWVDRLILASCFNKDSDSSLSSDTSHSFFCVCLVCFLLSFPWFLRHRFLHLASLLSDEMPRFRWLCHHVPLNACIHASWAWTHKRA